MTIDRILQVIDYYELKKSSLERELGIGNGYFGKMANKKGDVGCSIIEKMFYKFPEVSLKWLISGEGSMFEKYKSDSSILINEPAASYETRQPPGPCQQCNLRERLLEAKEETIRSLHAVIKANKIEM